MYICVYIYIRYYKYIYIYIFVVCYNSLYSFSVCRFYVNAPLPMEDVHGGLNLHLWLLAPPTKVWAGNSCPWTEHPYLELGSAWLVNFRLVRWQLLPSTYLPLHRIGTWSPVYDVDHFWPLQAIYQCSYHHLVTPAMVLACKPKRARFV